MGVSREGRSGRQKRSRKPRPLAGPRAPRGPSQGSSQSPSTLHGLHPGRRGGRAGDTRHAPHPQAYTRDARGRGGAQRVKPYARDDPRHPRARLARHTVDTAHPLSSVSLLSAHSISLSLARARRGAHTHFPSEPPQGLSQSHRRVSGNCKVVESDYSELLANEVRVRVC